MLTIVRRKIEPLFTQAACRRIIAVAALLMIVLCFSAPVFAQGGANGLDFSGIQTQGTAVKTFVLWLAALGGFLAVIFGIFKCFGGDWERGLVAAVAGGIILVVSAQSLGWTSFITGINL